nr:uncharacterized protein LOC123746695 isoform X2 [Procambarus clarkii]
MAPLDEHVTTLNLSSKIALDMQLTMPPEIDIHLTTPQPSEKQLTTQVLLPEELKTVSPRTEMVPQFEIQISASSGAKQTRKTAVNLLPTDNQKETAECENIEKNHEGISVTAKADVGDSRFCSNPYPCCYQCTCLYNCTGQLCTVLGNRYILTQLQGGFVLVYIKAPKDDAFACRVLWKGEKPIPLTEVADSTRVQFDAVTFPDNESLQALLIWKETKPTICTEPDGSNSYMLIDARGIFCNLGSLNINKGIINVKFDDDEVTAEVCDDVIFVDGKKSSMSHLHKYDMHTKTLYATVFKLFKGDLAGSLKYVCTCLWMGQKPSTDMLPMNLLRSKTYLRKSHGFYTEAKYMNTLYCDKNSTINISNNVSKITFRINGKKLSLPFSKDQFYNQIKGQMPSLSGNINLKAHILKQENECQNTTWTVLMIIPSSKPRISGSSSSRGQTQTNTENGVREVAVDQINNNLTDIEGECKIGTVSTQETVLKTNDSSSLGGQVRPPTCSTSILGGQVRPQTGSTSSLGGQVRPPTGSTSSLGGQVRPQTGSTSSLGGQVRPQTGSTSSLGGQVRPQTGSTSSLGGQVRPQTGSTSSLGGQVRPQTGSTSSLGGQTRPQTGSTSSLGGQVRPQTGSTSSLGGQVRPQTGSTSSLGGQVRPQTGSTSSLGGQVRPQTGSTSSLTSQNKLQTSIRFNNAGVHPMLNSLTCTVAEAERNMAILRAAGKLIFVTKENMFTNKKKVNKTQDLKTELKKFQTVGAIFYEVKESFLVWGYVVKHVAILAWAGKKPADSDDIIRNWKPPNPIHNPNHDSMSSKMEGQNSTKDKIFEASCSIAEIVQDMGILVIHNRNLNDGIGEAVANLSNFYKDGLPVTKKQLRLLPSDQLWHCLVQQRSPHKLKSGQPEFVVTIAWQGKKPSSCSSSQIRETQLCSSSNTHSLNSWVTPQTSGLTIPVRQQPNTTDKCTSQETLQNFNINPSTIKGRSQTSNINIVSNQTKSSNRDTECSGQTVPKLEYVTCSLVEVRTEGAVLKAGVKFILVLRKDLFISEEKVSSSVNIKQKLKQFPNVGAIIYQAETSLEIWGHSVKHAAVVVWAGKKPVDADNIVKTWKSKPVLLWKSKNEPSQTHSQNLPHKSEIFQTPHKSEIFQASCKVVNVVQQTAVLEVNSKHLVNGPGEAVANISNIYVDGLPISKRALLRLPKHTLLNCLVKKCPPVNSGKSSFLALLVWLGKKPCESSCSSSISNDSLSNQVRPQTSSTSSFIGPVRPQTSSLSNLSSPARPQTSSLSSLVRLQISGLSSPVRPQTSSTGSFSSPARPQTSSLSSPVRPQTSSLSSPVKPQTSSLSNLSSPVRPQTSSLSSPVKPQTSSLSSPVRPQTSSLSSPVKPQTSSLSSPVRPQTSSLSSPVKPQTSSLSSLVRPQTSSTSSLSSPARPQTSSTSSLVEVPKEQVNKKRTRRRKKNRKLDETVTIATEVTSQRESKSIYKGKITDLHPVLGQIQSDGGTLFFSRDLCYLYGLRLHMVELWHVLTLGEEVEYELAAVGTNSSGVSRVWVGGRDQLPPAALIPMVHSWCNRHSVPPAAAQILLQQAESLSPSLFPMVGDDEGMETVEIQQDSS